MYQRKTLSALILSTLLAPAAFAAEDGELGETSTGQLNIDLEITDSVEITSLDDINFGTYGGSDVGGINAGDAYCVYVNGGDDYTITPTSQNGSFVLKGDSFADEIEYSVKFSGNSIGADSASTTNYNSPSATFKGSVFRDCNSVNNASLDVSIAEQELRDASTDTYADTLILLVNPI